MSPRIKKKLAIALLLVTIIAMVPPAQADDPCAMSCQYEFDLCMASHGDCSTNAYYNYYNCQAMYSPDQSGVCNYFYWLDMQTCDLILHDCYFFLDFCLTSCQ